MIQPSKYLQQTTNQYINKTKTTLIVQNRTFMFGGEKGRKGGEGRKGTKGTKGLTRTLPPSSLSSILLFLPFLLHSFLPFLPLFQTFHRICQGYFNALETDGEDDY